MWLIAWRDMQFRRKQFLIAAIGGGLVFSMALLMTSLAGGFRTEADNTVAATGADQFVLRPGVGGPFTGYAGMPESTTDSVSGLSGVKAAYPMLVSLQQLVGSHGSPANIHLIGHPLDGRGAPRPFKGRSAHNAGEIVVDTKAKMHLGEKVQVAGQKLTVVGLTRGLSYDVGIANAYVTLEEAQRVTYGGGHLITFVAIRGTLAHAPAGFELLTAAEARKDMLSKLSDAISALTNVKFFLWVVAAVIIGIVTFLSALERLRDFAVLKAVGASSRQIYATIGVQSVIVAVTASLIGILLLRVLSRTLPLPLAKSTSSIEVLPLVAVLVGVLASIAGARQAIKVDPATAFGA